MPNQRSKKKMLVGGFVQYKLARKIEEIALEEEITKTEVLECLLEQGVERYKVSGHLGEDKPAEESPKQ